MEKGINAVYHRVMRRENFENAAQDLFKLLKSAQQNFPNKPRMLFVDIDGHRNEEGSFDQDMFELQTEFGMEFLLPFFKEVHFPLFSIKNPKEQSNDIPEELKIFNVENKKDTSLEDLYIENYSNTEFMSENDVYQYLKNLSKFIKKYNEFRNYKDKQFEFDKMKLIYLWENHINEMINELFNNFIHGNLLSASAMTRTLIECYVYTSILIQEQDEKLIDDWFLCSMIAKVDKSDIDSSGIINSIKSFCLLKNIDYTEAHEKYSKKNENSWLARVINKKRITFRDACNYLDESEIYDDFQFLCSFVHGQDLYSKIGPVTFYSSIYSKLFLMSTYIFKSIRMFDISSSLEDEIEDLEYELRSLGDKYL